MLHKTVRHCKYNNSVAVFVSPPIVSNRSWKVDFGSDKPNELKHGLILF